MLWINGAPSAIASSGVNNPGNSSYSTFTSFLASARVFSSLATTNATASPIYLVIPPTGINPSQSEINSKCPILFFPGTSSAVSTPNTPSNFRASDFSWLIRSI